MEIKTTSEVLKKSTNLKNFKCTYVHNLNFYSLIFENVMITKNFRKYDDKEFYKEITNIGTSCMLLNSLFIIQFSKYKVLQKAKTKANIL